MIAAIGVLAQAPAGVVEGGWSYVGAAYAATWLFFVGYAVSLVVRGRSAESEAREER